MPGFYLLFLKLKPTFSTKLFDAMLEVCKVQFLDPFASWA